MTWLKKEKKVLQCRTWFDWFRADEPRAPLLAAQGSCCNDSFIIKIKDQRAQTRHSSGVGGFSDDTGNNWREVSTIPASQKSATLRVWLYANTGCDCKLEKRGSWSIEIADVFQITRDTISLCQKKQQQKKQEEVDLCITVVCNFLKNWSKRHVLNSRLCVITMIHSLHGADWGAIWAAVLTETDGLLLLMSWTARKEQPHPRPLSSFQVRGGWRHFVSV